MSHAAEDPALDLAAFIVEEANNFDDLMPEVLKRFGHLGREAVERGIAIGIELVEARIAEDQHEILLLEARVAAA
ncbi:hypothetical protein OIU34_28100 [Pararhizobium sp. BT-229]|uniref:hypothetical protein n=1 Tax=Pararhizobium sp. BT-229 TaxID=2986923 RepID=UPI0021F73637|nr:hypothetical protein [Pararhizobium sp. BT-229]MCV9965737.1 hypothetical protein [Pararhizobium sp. BT-229]